MSLEALLEPVSAAAPAGPWLRGDFLYRQIELARRDGAAAPAERRRDVNDKVTRLAGEMLARRSKDLQVAAWLTEAWTFRDGLPGLTSGLEVTRALLDRYWDHVHPELEENDAEFRATSLEWMDRELPGALFAVPLTGAGHGVRAYKDSLRVGLEPDAEYASAAHGEWARMVADGWVSADAFDAGLATTPAALLYARRAEAGPARRALEALERLCAERFPRDAPRFPTLRRALQEFDDTAVALLEKKGASPDAPPAPAGPEADGRPCVAPDEAAVGGSDGGDPAQAGVAAPAEPDERGAAAPANGDAPVHAASPVRLAPAGPIASSGPDASRPAGSDVPFAAAGPPRSRDEAAERMAALARWLRSEQPTDPAPYLMVRGFRWGELCAGGARPDPRLLAAPPTDGRVRLRSLALDGRWAEVLDAAEEMMAAEHGRGWLDLQRYAATACENLGPAYDAVRQAVTGALRALLRAVPSLPSLALMDDTPAANAETLAWLRASGISPEGGAEAPVPAASVPDRARDRAAAGEPAHAVEILMAAADREPGARARFLLRTLAAEVLVEAGMEAVATPLLREMAAQVERHVLEEWEAGEVVAGPLALLCRCLDRLGDGAAERQALYRRVCRLDPPRAIQLGGGEDAAA
jgi:type VI secretion system protein ImpA